MPKMREITLSVTICMSLFGIVLTNVVPQPCQEVKDGLCSKGHYVVSKPDKTTCVQCPDNSFISFSSHNCENCKSHSLPNTNEIIERQGDATTDNIIACTSGFYRAQSSSQDKSECTTCSVCETGSWAAQKCSADRDTVCCLDGTIPAQLGNKIYCLDPDIQQIYDTGKAARTLNSRGTSNSTILDDDEGDEESVPDYSPSTGEEKPKRVMVDIPVWGQFLCLGIGIGIVVFFLGVGIPCNACGSLDKLRQLREKISKGGNRQASDEESKSPISLKSDTT